MNMLKYIFSFLLTFTLSAGIVQAQNLVEAPIPEAVVTDKEGVEEWLSEGENYSGQAPLKAR